MKREGIDIPPEIAEAEGIPDDLNALSTGSYVIPTPRRRLISVGIYAVAAVIAAIALPSGQWIGLAFIVLAIFHLWAAWPLNTDDQGALHKASTAVSFPVGHASAVVRFQGWRSRPMWNVLLYAAGDPPSHRALVVVDGVTGQVLPDLFEESLTPHG